MISTGEVPENREAGITFEMRPSDYSEDDFFAEQGVDLTNEANSRLRSLAAPVAEFHSRHGNGTAGARPSLRLCPPSPQPLGGLA